MKKIALTLSLSLLVLLDRLPFQENRQHRPQREGL